MTNKNNAHPIGYAADVMREAAEAKAKEADTSSTTASTAADVDATNSQYREAAQMEHTANLFDALDDAWRDNNPEGSKP